MNWRTATVGPAGKWRVGPKDRQDGVLRRIFANFHPGPVAKTIIRFRVDCAQKGVYTSDAAVARYLGCSRSYARLWRRFMVQAGVLVQAPQKHRYTAVGWRSYPLVVRLSDATRSLLAQIRRFAALRFKFASRSRTPIEQIKTSNTPRRDFWEHDAPSLARRFRSWAPVYSLAPPGRA